METRSHLTIKTMSELSFWAASEKVKVDLMMEMASTMGRALQTLDYVPWPFITMCDALGCGFHPSLPLLDVSACDRHAHSKAAH